MWAYSKNVQKISVSSGWSHLFYYFDQIIELFAVCSCIEITQRWKPIHSSLTLKNCSIPQNLLPDVQFHGIVRIQRTRRKGRPWATSYFFLLVGTDLRTSHLSPGDRTLHFSNMAECIVSNKQSSSKKPLKGDQATACHLHGAPLCVLGEFQGCLTHVS